MMQIEMEHQNVGMHGNAREELLGGICPLQFGDLVLAGETVALARLAQEMPEHVAGRLQRQAARREHRLVIDEARLAAARREHDDVLARPVRVAMRGVGVFGVKAGALAGELLRHSGRANRNRSRSPRRRPRSESGVSRKKPLAARISLIVRPTTSAAMMRMSLVCSVPLALAFSSIRILPASSFEAGT